MSRRTMQRFNKMKGQIDTIINSIKTNAANSVTLIREVFIEWEGNGHSEYIIGKLPDEISEKMDLVDTYIEVVSELSDHSQYYIKETNQYFCSLVERCFDYAIMSKNVEVVLFILSRYEKHISNKVVFNSVYHSIEKANYKFYKMLTNVFHINYKNLFITISTNCYMHFAEMSGKFKILNEIINNIMRNSEKVPFRCITDILIFICLNSDCRKIKPVILSYILKNLTRFVIGPYDFNENKYGYSYHEDRYNLFIRMVKSGKIEWAMTLVDDCAKYDICKIDIIHRDMNTMYEIVNEGFTCWDCHTNVKFIEWMYHHTNGAFSIPDYFATRAPYECMMGYYQWALHMRQIVLLIRKYYGKGVMVDMEPYARMSWTWCDNDDLEATKYYDEHSKHIRNIFSYGCVGLEDRVKPHAKFLI